MMPGFDTLLKDNGTYGETLARVMAIATREKLVVSTANEYEVFIDIDDSIIASKFKPDKPLSNQRRAPLVQAADLVHTTFAKVRKATYRYSKGLQGMHVTLTMRNPITDEQRVAIALIMGSDPKRELLRLKAIRDKSDDVPAIFLDRPEHPVHTLFEWSDADDSK